MPNKGAPVAYGSIRVAACPKCVDYGASHLLNCDDSTFNSRASLPFLTYSMVRKLANMTSIRMIAVTISSLWALCPNSKLSKSDHFAKEKTAVFLPDDSFRVSVLGSTRHLPLRTQKASPSAEF
jgi:hypothetical protein